MQIIIAVAVLSTIAFFAGILLSYASEKFQIETDEKTEEILKYLPGVNCGACGYPGCQGFAQALSSNEASPDSCTVISAKNLTKLKTFLGLETADNSKSQKRLGALIKCNGSDSEEHMKFTYEGIKDCQAAVLLQNGPWKCPHRCVGMGSCVAACPFGALSMGEKHIPVLDESKCVGCAKCVPACPKNLIKMVDIDRRVHVLCNSTDTAKEVREHCKVGCIGCKLCEKVCPTGAITVTDNLARLAYSKCTDCGLCAEKCPTKAIFVEPEQPNTESVKETQPKENKADKK